MTALFVLVAVLVFAWPLMGAHRLLAAVLRRADPLTSYTAQVVQLEVATRHINESHRAQVVDAEHTLLRLLSRKGWYLGLRM